MLQKTLGDLGIGRRDFIVVFGLLLNAFTWLFFLRFFIEQAISLTGIRNELPIWSAFYLSIIGFSIIGAVVSKRFCREKFLQLWIIFGVIASLLPVLFNNFTVTNLAVVSVIFGASFGLGMPSCLAFFTETTKVDNRGRVGGITFLIVFLVGPLLTLSLNTLSLPIFALVCAVWRGTGLSVCYLKPRKQNSPEVIETSFVSILRDRPFLLYFVAWLMFSVVDIMETPIVTKWIGGEESTLYGIMEIVEPILSTVFILVAGVMCDWVGRKKIVLSGFVSLGVAYAILGLFSGQVISGQGDFLWYLYFVVDGAAWGIFYLTFTLILWGDLSQSGSREKYYALGSVPFFLSYIIPYFVGLPSNDLGAAFSVAAFFLFLAVLPLISAPETLPEKKMELRRLRSFAEEAQKAKEKYERKL
jgi:MFS family permease